MARRRSWWAFGALALGLLIGATWDLGTPAIWFALAALLATGALLVGPRAVRVLLLASVTAAGVGWWNFRQRELPANSLAALLEAARVESPVPLTIEGVVLESPRMAHRTPGTLLPGFDRPAARFRLGVRRVIDGGRARDARGVMSVTVQTAPQSLPASVRAGSMVRLTGMGESIDAPMNPGEFDFRRWARDRDQVGSLIVPDAELVRAAGDAVSAGGAGSVGIGNRALAHFLRGRAWLRDRAERVMNAASDESNGPTSEREFAASQTRALNLSLFLGLNDPTHPEIDAAFNRLGLAHILAISGFHIVIMAWVVLQLVRLTGERGRLESVIVAALVGLYLLIVPPGAPVVRAGVTVLVMLLSESLERRYDRVTLMGWIGIGLLLWHPADLYSLGFVLSLGLTALLLWMGGVTHERLWGIQLRGTLDRPHAGFLPWMLEHVKQWISTSVLCWTVSAPLLLERVGTLSPLAIVSTVLLTPLIVPAMAAGFATLVLGMLVPGTAHWCGIVLNDLSRWTLDAIFWLEAMPGASVRVVGVTPAWAVAATVLIMLWHRAGHWRAWWCWTASALVLAWLGALVTRAGSLAPDVALRVDTLAVGDGTCQLLRVADRDGGHQSMLVDCGSTRVNIGRRLIPDALRALGVCRLDSVLITRPDPARYDALPDVIRTVGVGRVLVGREFMERVEAVPLGPEARTIAALERRGIDVEVVDDGDQFSIGLASASIIRPETQVAQRRPSDHALVMLVSVNGDGAALFTSDVREDSIGALRRARPELRARIAEAPAHGAVSVAAQAWLGELEPRVVIQSTGPRRAGDARWDSLRTKAAWLTTADDGACWAELLNDGATRSGSLRRPAPVTAPS